MLLDCVMPRVHRALPSRLCLFALIACGAGCGGTPDDEPVPAKRVVLRTAITADAAASSQFTTNFGWKVTLDQAAVAVGAVYYFNGTPAFTMRERSPTLLQRFGALFEGTAHAHPGHYQAGDALGQMLTASSYDLESRAPGQLADGEGVTGTFRSARFVYASSTTGPAAAVLGTHVAVARGVAEKADGTTPAPIHFSVFADYNDVAAQTTSGQVDGCTFTETEVTGDGTVTIVVSPNVWFNVVDFTDVAPGTAEAPTPIALGTRAGVGFVNGLTQLDAYNFNFTP